MSTFTKTQSARRPRRTRRPGDRTEDRTEEAFADGIDLLTGEVTGDGEEVSAEPDYLRGRDYVDADETLDGMTDGDLSPEPANA